MYLITMFNVEDGKPFHVERYDTTFTHVVHAAVRFACVRFYEDSQVLDPHSAGKVSFAEETIEAASKAKGPFSIRLPFGCAMSLVHVSGERDAVVFSSSKFHRTAFGAGHIYDAELVDLELDPNHMPLAVALDSNPEDVMALAYCDGCVYSYSNGIDLLNLFYGDGCDCE